MDDPAAQTLHLWDYPVITIPGMAIYSVCSLALATAQANSSTLNAVIVSTPGLIGVYVTYVQVKALIINRRDKIELERERMHLKHELELLRIKSATPQKEADSGEDTFNLGPIS